MRFGLGEKHDHTLEEVGQIFEVTRERIRTDRGQGIEEIEAPDTIETFTVFCGDIRNKFHNPPLFVRTFEF